MSIRQRVMVKLIPEDDFRDENCALRLMNKDLERGVTKIVPQASDDEISSELEDYDVDRPIHKSEDEIQQSSHSSLSSLSQMSSNQLQNKSAGEVQQHEDS